MGLTNKGFTECHNANCKLPAIRALVWGDLLMYYCNTHAKEKIQLGDFIGDPTATFTNRRMRPDEMMPNVK